MDRVAPVDRIRWDGALSSSLGLLQIETLDLTIQDHPNIAVVNDRVHVGNGSAPEYRVYGPDGTLLQIVRWKAVPVPATTEMRQSAIRRGLLTGPFAREFLPYYWALRLGPDDEVWLQDYEASAGSTTGWTVFGRDGRFIGRIEAPAPARGRVDAPWIGTDRILLAWRESDGTPHLSVHGIVRK